MANTNELKERIEPYVQVKLFERFGVPFSKKMLPLAGCTGEHEFDAVSLDGKIAASIKSSSGRTSGGSNPAGKFHAAFEELYFLNLVRAEKKLLVLTNKDFYYLFKKKSGGRVAPGLELWYCPLTAELEELTRKISADASDEIDRGKGHMARGSAAGSKE